jgi:hypothetical protein
MSELVLDDLEVGAGGVGQAGRTMAQVMQPDRRQPYSFDQILQPLGELSG